MIPRLFPFLLFFVASILPGAAAAAISAAAAPEGAIGLFTVYYQEPEGRLSLEQAIAARDEGKFASGTAEVLDLGLGAKPVWIHFKVDNATAGPLPRRVSVETAWLDQVDIHIRRQGNTVAAYQLGDSRPFRQRPVDSRFFMVPHDFAPGVSEVFIRVETPDPMLVPIHFMTPERTHARETSGNYSYGFIHGFLFALLAYNVMLYIGLRKRQYLLYSLYLGMFLLMNAAYTGYVASWLKPDDARWVQWLNPMAMMLYGASGLIFALSFLGTRTHLPRTHKAVIAGLAVFALLQLLAVLLGSQLLSLQIAFFFALAFTGVMLGMGIVAARSGLLSARYFLLAAITAMVGAAMTALSVLGLIPYNVVTYRTLEIGMLLDATLLALALAYQFRIGQEEKLRAEQLATIDPLTGINNRRAFYDKATALWTVSQRNNRDLSLILLDIDRFKHLNDAYGHTCGDEALVEIAKAIMESIRGQDVAARWGGEEFILLLPETDLQAAVVLAERLRSSIADVRLASAGGGIPITASLGVVQRGKRHTSLDALISSADDYLYQSKEMGRNRVSYPADA